MTSPYWAKLWIEILDDPKVANMPDWLFRKFIIFVLAAKEYDHAGLLQPVDNLAWRIRSNVKETADALSALEQIGVTRATADGWELINFVKRQEREYSDTPEAVRQRRYREKHHNEKPLQRNGDISVSVSTSVSDSFSDSDSLTKPNIFNIYENTIGIITGPIADKLRLAEKEYPELWVSRAFEISAEQNKRSWAYVSAIMERWRNNGYDGDKKNGKKPADRRDSEEARAKYAEWER